MPGKKQPSKRTTIAELLPRWMDQNNLNIGQTAKHLGVARETVHRWLYGKGEPWDTQIPKLAKKMGLRPEDFYPQPDPVAAGLEDRVELLEGQFSEGFDDLDTRLSAVEQLLGVGSQGDGKEARELLARRVEQLLSGEIAPAQPQSRRRRASGQPSSGRRAPQSQGRSPRGAKKSNGD